MPPSSSVRSSPFLQTDNPAIASFLRQTNPPEKRRKNPFSSSAGGLLKITKLLPMLTSGCKMATLLINRPRKPLLKDNATRKTCTLFGSRKGRVFLSVQEDPHCLPIFIIELPMLTSSLKTEMASDIVRIALESETKTSKKRLYEEFVWAVYCNGKKFGYSIRRKHMSEEERHVMQLLRGVSMGAGVLPCPNNAKNHNACSGYGGEKDDGEITYMRARFESVVGSKDSEALYMINPEGCDGDPGTELSIFFVRANIRV